MSNAQRRWSTRAQHDAEVQYQMPSQFAEMCEAAVAAGLTASPQEYWELAMKGDIYPDEGMTVLEKIVTGIVRRNDPAKADTRNPEQRVRDIMRALIGTGYHDYENDRDDRDILWKMTSIYAEEGKVDSDIRGVARRALAELRGEKAVDESAVRRLTDKFREKKTVLLGARTASDPRRESLEYELVAEIVGLLRSAGISVDLSPATPPFL